MTYWCDAAANARVCSLTAIQPRRIHHHEHHPRTRRQLNHLTTARANLKLEAVVIPVADVDRAKEFYEQPRLAARRRLRLRQRLPGRPVHAARARRRSVQFGTNITSAAPGSAQGLYLVVSDIEAARDELAARGVEVSEVFHPGTPGAQFQPDGTSGRVGGPAPDTPATAPSPRSATRTATAGCCRRSRPGCPAGSTPPRRRSPRRATWRSALRRAAAAHGEHEKRTGEYDENWPDWYAAYMVAEQAGTELPSVSQRVVIRTSNAWGQHMHGWTTDKNSVTSSTNWREYAGE